MKNEAFVRSVSEAFGLQLKRVRKKQGWNQDVFAEAMEVSRTTASNMECGRQRISLDQVYRAAHILKVPVTELLPPIQITNDLVRTAVDDPLSPKEIRSVTSAIRDLDHEPSSRSS